MLNKEQTVNLLNANKEGRLGHEGKLQAVQAYIKERVDKDFNPQRIDLGQLELAFNFAMEWFMRKFTISILRDKTNRILKFY